MVVHATGTTGTIGRHIQTKVQKLEVDLSEKVLSIPQRKFQKADTVIHLAGIVGAQSVEKDLQHSYRINVESTIELGLTLKRSPIKKMVYVSTSHVYDYLDRPLCEDDVVQPRSEYASQKREAEVALLEIFSDSPERLCVARVFSVLDWDVPAFTLGGAVAKLRDENLGFVLGNGGDIRDFLTPKTVASALLEISQNENLFGISNVCSGSGLSVKEAALAMLNSGAGSTTYESRIDPGFSNTPYIVGDNSKLRTALPHLDLSWTPSTPT
jgi:nucleoside-diphosphate-sugar epimerase